jgi:hypothetical protein
MTIDEGVDGRLTVDPERFSVAEIGGIASGSTGVDAS